MNGKILAAVAAILLASGVCVFATVGGPPTLDASSQASLKASIQRMRNGMSPERQKELEQSVLALLTHSLRNGRGNTGNLLADLQTMTKNAETALERVGRTLHGMTADEILAAGRQALAANRARFAARTAGTTARETAEATPVDLLQARIDANEAAAIATLRNLGRSQLQCQASAEIDADGDGIGEFGYFAELAGAVPVRAGATTIAPPLLSDAFGRVAAGRVERSGYVFQIFLPDAQGGSLAEAANGGGRGIAVAADRAEVGWRCYAWPTDHGQTGRRAFFIDESQCVLACDNTRRTYSGSDRTPAPEAARLPAGNATPDATNPENPTDPRADGDGNDGEDWRRVR